MGGCSRATRLTRRGVLTLILAAGCAQGDPAGQASDALDAAASRPPDAALDASISDAPPADGPATDADRPDADSADAMATDAVPAPADATSPSCPTGCFYTGIGDINGIWGFAADDVWAVGGPGKLLHFDGATWNPTAPPTGLESTYFTGVWGAGPNDVWVSGGNGGAVLIHWDGSQWSSPAIPAGSNIYRIHGAAADRIWAGTSGTHVLFYDGTTWTEQATPATAGPTYSVFAVSASEAWAGGNGALLHTVNGGATWMHHTDTSGVVWDLHGTGADDIWAAVQGGVLLHYDGNEWTTVPEPASDWNGVFALAPEDAWGAGGSGILRWDGIDWTVSIPNQPGSNLTSAWALSPDEAWIGAIGTMSLVRVTP